MAERLDKEKARKNLKEILGKTYTDADPALLKEYHKIFKKEISLFRRSWAAAWLFMYYDKKEIPSARFAESPQVYSEKKSVKDDKSLPEVILSEDESKRLFVSIGKNRRLYPRELSALISSKTSAEREDIGSIRILDNYSFVQVRDTKADEIIQALNGTRFRGRTLAVNFAKSKTESSD